MQGRKEDPEQKVKLLLLQLLLLLCCCCHAGIQHRPALLTAALRSTRPRRHSSVKPTGRKGGGATSRGGGHRPSGAPGVGPRGRV